MRTPGGHHTRFDVDDLATYHRNPRRGDVSAIVTSLRASGQYRPIVVNAGTLTGRRNEVLAGNHTLAAMREIAAQDQDSVTWTQIDAWVIDVDDDTAARIVAADNRLAQLGWIDDAELLALLDDMPTLDGTGYSDDDIADIRALVEEMNTPPPPPPRISDDGLIRSRDINTHRDNYAARGTRLIVMSLPVEAFVWTQRKLGEYRAAHSLDSNNDAVMKLLADWSGEPAPTTPEPAEIEQE